MYGYLQQNGITARVLGPDERDQPDSKLVRIATMHRAKGLEFDEVVLWMPKNWGQTASSTYNIKQLQYVAMTRAKKIATVLKY